jgi:hypothetical protein
MKKVRVGGGQGSKMLLSGPVLIMVGNIHGHFKISVGTNVHGPWIFFGTHNPWAFLPTDPWALSVDIFIMSTKKYPWILSTGKLFMIAGKKCPWILPSPIDIHGYFIMSTGPE